MEFYETDESRDFYRGAKWALLPSGGPLATTQEFPWGNAVWGERLLDTVKERLGHGATWAIICEDLPDEANTVTISSDIVDDFGLPVPKLTYKTSENSTKLMRWHEQRAIESMTEAGAVKTAIAPQIRNIGWHLLGTAKMGHDPRSSVVDGEGRAHDIPNLFVFDGSSWPTSSGTNPTGTVVALALRNTERLIRKRADQETPA
jgi:choline dehydrogenase-like flavoprotein